MQQGMIKLSDIVTKDVYRHRLDPLTSDEREVQKQSIQQDGMQDAVVLTTGNVLIDGHHRYDIAKELSLKVIPFRIKVFKSEEEIPQWIDDWHQARRSLTPQQKAIIRGRRYNVEKQGQGGDRKSNRHDDGLISTAAKIATEEGVSPRTIERNAKLAQAIDSLPANLQTAHKNKALRGTDEELIALSKLPGEQQQQVARRQRAGGQGLGEAIKAVSGKSAATVVKPAKDKPPRKAKVVERSPAKLADAMIRAISPLVRQLDMLAQTNGGKGKCHKQANDAFNLLIGAVKKMRTGEQ